MSRVVFLASFASVTLACGARNSAVAEPKKGAATVSSASSSEPLVPYALDADADVVRALREHYTKYEYKIRMRDGVHLHTHALPCFCEVDVIGCIVSSYQVMKPGHVCRTVSYEKSVT